MFSWHSALLVNHRDNFTLPFTLPYAAKSSEQTEDFMCAVVVVSYKVCKLMILL
jgi:hypothetical protein